MNSPKPIGAPQQFEVLGRVIDRLEGDVSIGPNFPSKGLEGWQFGGHARGGPAPDRERRSPGAGAPSSEPVRGVIWSRASECRPIRFEVQTNEQWVGTMMCPIKRLLSISLFAIGVFFSNAAQACTPTIYLFRHAEDSNGLTAVGLRHADLYPMMIQQLQKAFPICDVQRVFAMWSRNGAGTSNPYYTAKPLAQDVGGETARPEMFVTDTQGTIYYLCEYPIDEKCTSTPGFDPDVDRNALADSSLYSYLIAYFQSHTTASVAIFYTSQGMPSVSNVLGVFPVVVTCINGGCTQTLPPTASCPLPVSEETTNKSCYANENRLLSWPGIQRSSVDLFDYSGENRFIKQYTPISPNLSYVKNLQQNLNCYQCFNFNRKEEKLSTEYYCQYSVNLGNDITINKEDGTLGKNHVKLTDINAKICYAPNIAPNGSENTDNDSFGHCL
jgi:hypothetical protein